MEVQRARPGADVALASIGRERYRVSQVTSGQVVADGAVHVVLSGKGGETNSRPPMHTQTAQTFGSMKS